jgi:hypothetical protein
MTSYLYHQVFFMTYQSQHLQIAYKKALTHRHLSNKDCLMVHTACLVCFNSTVNGRSKKRSLGRPALIAGT